MRSWCATAIIACVLPIAVNGQGRPLTVAEVTQVFYSGGDEAGWDEFMVPKFVAAAYGPRAKSALEEILREPSTPQNYYVQLEALTAAQYPRVGVSTDIVRLFAGHGKSMSLPPEISGILRQRAIKALSTHPDPNLTSFWDSLASDPNPMFRQFVAFGIACALGDDARARLQTLASTNDSVAVRQSNRALQELGKGASGRVCGESTRLGAPTFPADLPENLRLRGRGLLQRIPQ